MNPKNGSFYSSSECSKDAPKFMDEMALYREIYDLKHITKTIRVNKEYFDYCKAQTNFLILVLYDKNGKVYLKENGVNQFKLLGGKVLEEESVRDAVKRYVRKEFGKEVVIDELEPIAISTNVFKYEEMEVEHIGLAVIARIDDEENFGKSAYLVNSILPLVNQFSDRCILELFEKRFSNMLIYNSNEFQDEEIEVNRRYQSRYRLHNNIVKKYLLTSKRKRKQELIQIMSEKANGCSRFLDVSCGDNSLLFTLDYSEDFEFIVANDISWSQIELIPRMKDVYFTNHNAITFPFKDNAFDFVYCSNTLHHMPNRVSINNLLDSMLRVGKKVVIYEIENPSVTGGFPHYLNKYWYRGFLKDAGEEYLSFDEFKKIIINSYKGRARIKFSNFRNIQGNYMIAEIEKL